MEHDHTQWPKFESASSHEPNENGNVYTNVAVNETAVSHSIKVANPSHAKLFAFRVMLISFGINDDCRVKLQKILLWQVNKYAH